MRKAIKLQGSKSLKSKKSKKKKTKFSKGFNNELAPLKNCLRIGTRLYIIKDGELIDTNDACLRQDHGNDYGKRIRKFYGFKNEPNHLRYKRNFNGWYNLYRKLQWKPKKGTWENIDKMLKHIFKGTHYKMVLTYFYVLYCIPKQPLPSIGLVGGQNTGKSKFLELVMFMFNPNSISIDPEDLAADFNESYIDKLIITIDEKAEGGSKRKIMQRLKKLITGGTQIRKAKFKANIKVGFFGKIIMASNDTEDMLALESENTRFWIIEVPKLETDEFDILEKAKKEVPAFFHYLTTKYKPLKRESRVWFAAETYQTISSKKMQENARPELIKALIENLSNYFLENEDEKEIYFTAEQFIEAYGKKERWNSTWFSRDVKKFFNKKSYAKRKDNPFHDIIIHSTSGNTVGISNEIKQRRYYHFTKKEINALNIDYEEPKKRKKTKNNKNNDYDSEDDLPF